MGAVVLSEERWVLTGAAGRLAQTLRPGLAEHVAGLRLLDLETPSAEHPVEETVSADLRDPAAVLDAVRGAAGVLHLGALSDEADFHDLAEVNIVGTFHVLEAARRAGVRRVVFASSTRTTGFYPSSERLTPELPPRPDGLYGVSKVAGEALCRLYADKFALSVVCLRIGSFELEPRNQRHLSTWLSPRDALAAVLAAMRAPDIGFAVFYGVSRNTRRWWDLRPGEALGYHPEDDAERFAERVAPSGPGEHPELQGGLYTTPEFTLERQRPL